MSVPPPATTKATASQATAEAKAPTAQPTRQPKRLVVTIPAQNEAATIARVVGEIPRDLPGIDVVDVVVMNDASTDDTAELAKEAGAIVVNVTGRPGLGQVFKHGIEAAMARGAHFVVNIDGDGQFNPGDIRQLVQPLVADEADFVTCTRFKNPEFIPTMPAVKFWGNWAVVKIVNTVCGGTKFTDVSCGFRGFNRDALYRLTLFGRYTYTQECFIDLFSKNLRIVEIPLVVRGVREHGKSRVAGSVWKYATNTLPIMVRAMRDIRPLKFFGLIGGLLLAAALLAWAVVGVNYAFINPGKTRPFTSFVTIGGVMLTLSFVMGVLALLADMMARHRRITEELLYLARRRIYGNGGVDIASTRPGFVSPAAPRLAEAATKRARDRVQLGEDIEPTRKPALEAVS
ncbi:MAG: glycosyltransferase family 2 protein [Planctomycetota bacterium]